MTERYSTLAIACGLSDVAGWLENEGWIPKHVRQIRLGVERLREVEAKALEAADAIESVALRLPAYSPPAELLLRHAWMLRAAQGIEAAKPPKPKGSAEGESPVGESRGAHE